MLCLVKEVGAVSVAQSSIGELGYVELNVETPSAEDLSVTLGLTVESSIKLRAATEAVVSAQRDALATKAGEANALEMIPPCQPRYSTRPSVGANVATVSGG